MLNTHRLPARRNLSRMRGIGMLDMILAFALTAVIATGTLSLLNQTRDDTDAKNVAEHLSAFQSAATNFALKKRAEILAAATDGTGAGNACVVNYVSAAASAVAVNTTKKTCAVDASYLKYVGELPASFSTTNAFGQAPVAIYRRVYNGATATDNLEMLVVSASQIGTVSYANAKAAPNSSSLFKAMAMLGSGAGVVMEDKRQPSCLYDAADVNNRFACGTQGAWKAKLADFVN